MTPDQIEKLVDNKISQRIWEVVQKILNTPDFDETTVKLEIEKTLVVSISHITAECSQWLHTFKEDSPSFVVADNEYYYEISLSCYHTVRRTRTLDTEYLKCLGPILHLAAENDCHRLRLDRDGPIVEGLMVYEW